MALSIFSAYTDTVGANITLPIAGVVTEPLLPTGGVTGFSVTVGGLPASISSATVVGVQVVLVLTVAATSGQAITVSYSGSGNLVDSTGTPNTLAAVSNISVVNFVGKSQIMSAWNESRILNTAVQGVYSPGGFPQSNGRTFFQLQGYGAEYTVPFIGQMLELQGRYPWGPIVIDNTVVANIPATSNSYGYEPIWVGTSGTDTQHEVRFLNIPPYARWTDTLAAIRITGASPSLMTPTTPSTRRVYNAADATFLAATDSVHSTLVPNLGWQNLQTWQNGLYGSIRFKATINALQAIAADGSRLNGSNNKVYLRIDSGAWNLVTVTPDLAFNQGRFGIASGLDDMAEHTYTVMFPVSQGIAGFVTVGGTGINLSPIARAKTLQILGDSRTAGTGPSDYFHDYAWLLWNAVGMTPAIDGAGGRTVRSVTYPPAGSPFAGPETIDSLEGILANSTNKITQENPSYVVIWLGVNDAGFQQYDTAGTNPTTIVTPTQVQASLKTSLGTMYAANPTAKFILVSNQSSGHPNAVDAMNTGIQASIAQAKSDNPGLSVQYVDLSMYSAVATSSYGTVNMAGNWDIHPGDSFHQALFQILQPLIYTATTVSGESAVVTQASGVYHLAGTNTNWSGMPFSLVNGGAATLAQTIHSTTSADLTITANGTLPPYIVTDGAKNFQLGGSGGGGDRLSIGI